MLGELAIGGDLAAEHGEQRRQTLRRTLGLDLEGVVARDRRRVGGFVVVERPDAREAVHHVGSAQIAREVAVDHRQQVVDLGGLDRDILGLAVDRDVGRADQR
jgi:hypothetical protein